MRLGAESQFGDFIEGLGPAQLVGRQVLGSACLGEIQLGLYDRKGHLEVEVIRARGLLAKLGAKILPGMFMLIKPQNKRDTRNKKGTQEIWAVQFCCTVFVQKMQKEWQAV